MTGLRKGKSTERGDTTITGSLSKITSQRTNTKSSATTVIVPEERRTQTEYAHMKIILTGEPKSTQTCYKYTCRGSFVSGYMDKKCKDIKEDYYWQAKSQYKGKPLTSDLELTVELFFGTKRVQDWDNFHKLSMDALTGVVWEDDSQIQVAHVYKKYDKENPRIEITIS